LALFKETAFNNEDLDFESPNGSQNGPVIEIFDTGAIDFFMKSDRIGSSEENLVLTIKDSSLSLHSLQHAKMRFSTNLKYFFMIYEKKQIVIYDLEASEDGVVREALYKALIPED
jgi:hypothetical protein